MSDRWDETHEPPGWGEHASGSLVDALMGGLDALVDYAITEGEIPEPTTAAMQDLLAEAERELPAIDSPDRQLAVLDAIEDLRRQLAATTVTPIAA